MLSFMSLACRESGTQGKMPMTSAASKAVSVMQASRVIPRDMEREAVVVQMEKTVEFLKNLLSRAVRAVAAGRSCGSWHCP